MLNSAEKDALCEVLSSRQLGRPPDLLDRKFKRQTDFILDPSKLKAAYCTRRAAKSYSGGLAMVKAALENPGVSCLYIALTRASAKGIMWKDVLKDINRRHKLGMQFNEAALTATLPNGSVLYLTGVDADEEEKQKLLGQKYFIVICDESSMYGIDLRELIYGILKPAVADYRGTICMLGTSGNITQGLFYDITRKDGPREPGWSVHEWSAHENPYIAKQWQEELEEIDRERPLFKLTALYRQWYLNEWVIDTNKLVYWYQEGRNDYLNLPHYSRGEWQFVLGVDLGYSPDPTAFSLVGFHENDRTLYGIESQKQLEMDLTDVANRIKEFHARYSIFKVVIDGSNKQAVQEMQRRKDVALTAADKREKADFIALLNSEFVQHQIKVNPKTNEELVNEWKKLVWKTEGEKIVFPRIEHPGLPNHCSDAFLYAWRFCYQYLSQAPKKPVNLNKRSEYIKHTQKLMEESLERQIEAQRAQESDDDFFALSDVDPFADQTDVLKHYVNKRKK